MCVMLLVRRPGVSMNCVWNGRGLVSVRDASRASSWCEYEDFEWAMAVFSY